MNFYSYNSLSVRKGFNFNFALTDTQMLSMWDSVYYIVSSHLFHIAQGFKVHDGVVKERIQTKTWNFTVMG